MLPLLHLFAALALPLLAVELPHLAWLIVARALRRRAQDRKNDEALKQRLYD